MPPGGPQLVGLAWAAFDDCNHLSRMSTRCIDLTGTAHILLGRPLPPAPTCAAWSISCSVLVDSSVGLVVAMVGVSVLAACEWVKA